jgi:haloalkane dehalogenase
MIAPTLTTAAAADLFRNAPDRFLDVGAGEVAYRRIGSGPDVLFVHGWPVSGATFRTLLPYLADHVTCHVIDLPGAGSSRFTPDTTLSFAQHVESVRRVIDQLELDDYAIVGHDSGGLIARHAVAGDHRLRAMGLIDTEQHQGLSWRFKLFIASRFMPGFASAFGWVAGQPRLRRNKFVLGDAFVNASLLDGEFDEFFLEPLHRSTELRRAAAQVLRSFDMRLIRDLREVHRSITVPVQLVWGEHDAFLPVAWAKEMVDTFPNARLTIIEDAGLFAHEERPAEVADALLPVLIATS